MPDPIWGASPTLPVDKTAKPSGRAKKPKEGMEVYFTDTYKKTIAENEKISQKSPNNPDKKLIELIDSAAISLDGSFYDIGNDGIVDALIRAHKRGVTVRIVTDSDNMVDKTDPAKSRTQVDRLKKAGIEVKEDNRSGIMHNKFLVVDHHTVWTGSTNLTQGSLYHHNNDAIKFVSKEMAANYDAEFTRLWGGQFSKVERSVPYPEVDINGIKVKPFFSPNGNGLDAVIKELKEAKSSIKFMTFSLTDPQIGEILIDKHKKGVKVEGIFDTWLGAGAYSLYPKLKEAGIPVYKDGNEALLHHKVIIIDGKTLITGSYNFSKNAETSNNENFVIIKNAGDQIKKYEEAYDKTLQLAKTRTAGFKPASGGNVPAPKAPPKTQLFPDAVGETESNAPAPKLFPW